MKNKEHLYTAETLKNMANLLADGNCKIINFEMAKQVFKNRGYDIISVGSKYKLVQIEKK